MSDPGRGRVGLPRRDWEPNAVVKGLLIGVANVVIVVFVFFVDLIDNPGPELAVYYVTGVLTTVIAWVPVGLFVGLTQTNSGPGSPTTRATERSRRERFLDYMQEVRPDGGWRRGDIYLVVITVGSYLAIGELAHLGGGMRGGAFAQFPVGVVVLSPLLMTGGGARFINFVGGAAFVAALHFSEHWLGWLGPTDGWPGVSHATVLFGTLSIVLVSLAFTVDWKWLRGKLAIGP